jgi:hypothetical protein
MGAPLSGDNRMASINYNDLKEGLLELNPDLEFDDGQMWDYFGIAKGHRIGIEYFGNHITNCDTGDIREHPLEQKVMVPTMIHPDKRDFHKTSTRKWVVYDNKNIPDPIFIEADLALGKRTRDVVTIGGYPVIAERGDLTAHVNRKKISMLEEVDAITIYTYWEETEQDNFIVCLGWRVTLGNLIKTNIPGITKEAVEEKFDIVM